jgi:hypothetical protein
LASPEDMFNFEGEDASQGALEQGSTAHPSVLAMNDPIRRAARRELGWFYTQMRGRVPVVGTAPAHVVAAASRIAGWLSELAPIHRGAFVVRYDGRRWPVRIIRQFGGVASVAVRIAAMRRERGPTETLAEAEHAVVTKLLAHIAAARGLPGFTRPGASRIDSARVLRRLHRGAQSYVWRAESAYSEARGAAPCVVPARSKEGA